MSSQAPTDNARRRSDDQLQDQFDQMREDLGPFWVIWLAAFPGITLIGCWLLSHRAQAEAILFGWLP